MNQEIKAIYSKEKTLRPLLYMEGRFILEFLNKFCKENGGEKIKNYCMALLGSLINKYYLENIGQASIENLPIRFHH